MKSKTFFISVVCLSFVVFAFSYACNNKPAAMSALDKFNIALRCQKHWSDLEQVYQGTEDTALYRIAIDSSGYFLLEVSMWRSEIEQAQYDSVRNQFQSFFISTTP